MILVWWMLVTKASDSHGVMLGKEAKEYGKGWTERLLISTGLIVSPLLILNT